MRLSVLQRRRILVALLIGGAATILGLIYRIYNRDATGDLYYPLCAAESLLRGMDPFGSLCIIVYQGQFYPMNPLTTTLVVLPFRALLPRLLVSSLLPGLASGLLAYGLTDKGQWWRLLVFSSGAYWLCLQWAQWGILIAAIATLPTLLPLTLVKPQIGLPLLLTRATPRRIAACIGFGIISLVIMPDWPLRYLRQGHLESYTSFIPLLTLPLGPLLAGSLLLIRKHTRAQRLWDLALYSIMPQRSIYDLAVLWTIPGTWATMALLSACSWVPFFTGKICTLLHISVNEQTLVVVCIYLPLLIMVALEERHSAAGQTVPITFASTG